MKLGVYRGGLLGVLLGLLCCGVACAPPAQRCEGGISNLSLNSSGSPCKGDCDCSNQRYEGVCVDGTCQSRVRSTCRTAGGTEVCQILPSPKTGLCQLGSKVCKDVGLQDLYWGDCKVLPVKEIGVLCGNQKDDDCDGKVDANDSDCRNACVGTGVSRTCLLEPPVGSCQQGLQLCGQDGLWGPCKVEKVLELGERCLNQKDDDCDGKTDFADADCKDFCRPGESRACGSGKGECRQGSQTCKDSATWGVCEGEGKPKAEDCNQKDDDCDGEVDEADKGGPLTRGCFESKVGCQARPEGGFACEGPCLRGMQVCENGTWGVCAGQVLPKQEECNGKDDDCDGKVDVDSKGDAIKRPCYETAGDECVKQADGSYVCRPPCKAGEQTCQDGKWGSCEGAIEPKKETCDGRDEDCDGKVDAPFAGALCKYTGPAGTQGQGPCTAGREFCQQGVVKCVGEVLPAAQETCHDGVDNDCNGKTDEGCTWVLSTGGNQEVPHVGKMYSKPAGLAVDAQNNVYLSAEFVGTQQFGNKQMTSQGTTRDTFLAKVNVQRSVDWVISSSAAGDQEGRSVALLGGTHLGWVGTFSGMTTIGGSHTLTSTNPSHHTFVVRTDLTGKVQWAKAFTGGGAIGAGVAAGQNGGLYASAQFAGNLTAGSKTFSSAGSTDAFLAMLDDKGQLLWTNQIQGAGEIRPLGLCSNSKGDVYIVGFYYGAAIQVGLEAGAPTLVNTTGSSLSDGFVAKVDASSGKFVWAKAIQGMRFQEVNTCFVDANGDALLAGNVNGASSFGSIGLNANSNPSSDAQDAFVAKIDKTGKFLWAKGFGGSGDDRARGITADPAGNIYVVGLFQGAVQFGSRSFFSQGQNQYDGFVLKLDKTGKVLWANVVAGAGMELAANVVIAPNGQVVVAGFHSFNAVFGSTPITGSAAYLRSFVWWLTP